MMALRRHSRPISLAELLAAQRGERPLPRRSVLVTFDDAYRDFGEIAWPVLRRLGIPATLFVPTAYPGYAQRAFWWDRLWHAVTQAAGRSDLRTPAGVLPLATPDQRRLSARTLIEFHKGLPHDEAMHSVDELCSVLAIGQPKSDVLTWDELRVLAGEGVALAAHSRNHPLLTRVASRSLRDELDGARRDLETHVPGAIHGTVFAYPGGRYDKRVTDALMRLGFMLAFTTERGLNRLGATHRLRLRRINVGMLASPQLIRAQLAMSTLRYRTIGR